MTGCAAASGSLRCSRGCKWVIVYNNLGTYSVDKPVFVPTTRNRQILSCYAYGKRVRSFS